MAWSASSLLWFVAIVAAIPVTLWFLKRTPLGGAGAGSGLRSVGTLALSTSQRIVTVEVGSGEEKRWLVLGITPTTITTLHTMAAQPLDAGADKTTALPVHPAFAQILGRLKRRETDAGDGR